MILAEQLDTYLDSLRTDNGAFLDDLEAQARLEGVPVIQGQVQSFLKVLLAARRPQRILEIGTAVGFSALFMAEYTDAACKITTIENYKTRITAARENFLRAGMQDRISLLAGEAADILPSLEGPFDFVFLDAAKGQYLSFLPELLRLMPEGGLLVADDVLQEGTVSGPRSDVRARKRTIYDRIRDFLQVLTHTEGLLTSVLPVGDGISVTVKRSENIKLGGLVYD